MEFKAIDTIYNGYKFRSRLEARWAVYFDTLGIEYRYEPEGFNLNGVWYLPDFYLPQVEMYAEIKHDYTKEDIDKCLLFNKTTHIPILMLDSSPNTKVYWAADIVDDDDETVFTGYVLNESHEYWINEGRFYYEDSHEYGLILPIDSSVYCSVGCLCDCCDYKGAIKKARQARFEFGHEGN